MTGYQFLVLHIMQGTLHSTDLWFHDPASRASAHFGVGQDGTVYQWVDTADRAWAQAAGNPVGISIEHEGSVPAALTDAQIAADAAILAWLHQVHGIPLQVTDDPVAGSGVCGHSTGAARGWGHPFCPGQAILDQRQQIVAAATALLALPAVTAVSPAGGDVPGTGLTVVSDSQLTVTSPAPDVSGPVDVVAYTGEAASAVNPADQFSYSGTAAAPVIAGVSPSTGAAGGGDSVAITGSGFAGATDVAFGTASAAAMTIGSDGQITATSPAGTGTVDITVTTPAGTSAQGPADQFTYASAG